MDISTGTSGTVFLFGASAIIWNPTKSYNKKISQRIRPSIGIKKAFIKAFFIRDILWRDSLDQKT
jgi:hypothetical protein